MTLPKKWHVTRFETWHFSPARARDIIFGERSLSLQAVETQRKTAAKKGALKSLQTMYFSRPPARLISHPECDENGNSKGILPWWSPHIPARRPMMARSQIASRVTRPFFDQNLRPPLLGSRSSRSTLFGFGRVSLLFAPLQCIAAP